MSRVGGSQESAGGSIYLLKSTHLEAIVTQLPTEKDDAPKLQAFYLLLIHVSVHAPRRAVPL